MTSTTISGSTSNSFNTVGIFAESLTIAVDLTGLANGADNFGIDNIQFSQRAVPESAGSILLMGLFGLISKRRCAVH